MHSDHTLHLAIMLVCLLVHGCIVTVCASMYFLIHQTSTE